MYFSCALHTYGKLRKQFFEPTICVWMAFALKKKQKRSSTPSGITQSISLKSTSQQLESEEELNTLSHSLLDEVVVHVEVLVEEATLVAVVGEPRGGAGRG